MSINQLINEYKTESDNPIADQISSFAAIGWLLLARDLKHGLCTAL